MNRRDFFRTSFIGALATGLRAADANRPPRILLLSSWQVVNIGDIAHSPGVPTLIEKHMPDAEVTVAAPVE